jgi:spermidine/putrescine-binding protein
MMTISRRTLMQMMGASAGALGTPFGKNSKAFAAREKEMNILCWEGYNSGQVLDPFRKKEGATVKAESLTNDPTHDKSAARRRDQCLGFDQCQQSLGAQSDVASKADQAAAARSVRALL